MSQEGRNGQSCQMLITNENSPLNIAITSAKVVSLKSRFQWVKKRVGLMWRKV